MNCPVCSRSVKIKWINSNLIQCDCNSIIYLKASGNWSIANSGITKIPSTYIKPGTQGIYSKNKFTVTGRIFAQNEEAAINYWSIVFDNGSRALLMDGYGHFSVIKKAEAPFDIKLVDFKSMHAGHNAPNKNKKHRLVRKENYFKITVEGENEWSDAGLGFDVYDFFSADGQFTSIIRFSGGNLWTLGCEFFKPEELKFSNTINTNLTRVHKCENCAAENIIHAHPFTFTVNCKKCFNRHEYDVNKDVYVKTKSWDEGHEPFIEIETKGIMDGIEFKVIGYARKKETASQAEWNEYTLYNPQMGFAYLSEFEGHWVYVKEWPRPPIVTAEGKDYFVENGNEFELYNDYHYKVIGAVGEHIYDLNKTTEFAVTEYIYPPQILTKEKNRQEENWFYGDHIDGKTIKSAFKLQKELPYKKGVGAVQPLALIKKSTLFFITAIGVILLAAVHIISHKSKQDKNVFSEILYFNDGAGTLSGISPHFNLDKKESNLQLQLDAQVDNSWVEFEGSFVNTKTGKEYNFNKGVEYYQGYDDGGSWTEGSRTAEVIITEIPAGDYYLEYKVMKDSIGLRAQNLRSVNMNVRYDVPLSRNVLWVMGLVVLVAVIQFIYYYYNDKRRWENSKYTPYNYE